MEEKLRLSGFVSHGTSFTELEAQIGRFNSNISSVRRQQKRSSSSGSKTVCDQHILEPHAGGMSPISEDDKIMFSHITENPLPEEIDDLSRFQIFSSTEPFTQYSESELSKMKGCILVNNHDLRCENNDYDNDEISVYFWVCPYCAKLPEIFRTENYEIQLADNFDDIIQHQSMCQKGVPNLQKLSEIFLKLTNLFPLFQPNVLNSVYFIGIVKILTQHNTLVDIFTKGLFETLHNGRKSGCIGINMCSIVNIYPPPHLDEAKYKMAISALAIFARTCMNGSIDILDNELFKSFLRHISPGFAVPDKNIFEYYMSIL